MVTVAELESIQKETATIEAEKAEKKRLRLEKKKLKEDALRWEFRQKFIAPILLALTLLFSALVWLVA